jgi:D-threo-aldose 1-dehydrogenase
MMKIETRPLGRTGIEVTSLCLGTSALGSMPGTYGYEVSEQDALATLRRAFAGPVTFVDTSNIYGFGASERLIGQVLAEIGGLPDGFVLATKVDPDSRGDFSGRRVLQSLRESYKRLGLDRIPLVYLHDPEKISWDAAMAPGGPVAMLRRLHKTGEIEHLGVAGGPIELMRRFVRTGLFEVVITHNRFTLVDRSAEPLLDDCATAGVALLNAAPFGGGMLVKGPRAYPNYAYHPARPEIRASAAAIEALCKDAGVPLAAVALQFSMRDPRVTSTVFGVTRPDRYDEILALAGQQIPGDLWSQIDQAVASPEYWLD